MSNIINRPASPEGDKELADGWYWLRVGLGDFAKPEVRELKKGVWQWGHPNGAYPKTSVFVISRVDEPKPKLEPGYYWAIHTPSYSSGERATTIIEVYDDGAVCTTGSGTESSPDAWRILERVRTPLSSRKPTERELGVMTRLREPKPRKKDVVFDLEVVGDLIRSGFVKEETTWLITAEDLRERGGVASEHQYLTITEAGEKWMRGEGV